MTSSVRISLAELLDLADSQREIVLHLVRNGPADAASLAAVTGLELVEVESTVRALAAGGRVRLLPDGRVEVVLGRVKSRTTLPAQLWHALQSTDRLYSEQDVAALRAALPILHLARARLVEFADHGPGHALRVKAFASQLGYVVGLTPLEQQLLRVATLFHDAGNLVDRERHNVVSQEMVLRLAADGSFPFSAKEAEIIGLLCSWHRGHYDPERCDELEGGTVRTGFLASVLRVTDAMDIDHRRSDYSDRFAHVLRLFYPTVVPFWSSLQEILGVRVRCTPGIKLQVFTKGHVDDNLQIDMLRADLESTPLDWTIDAVAVAGGLKDDPSSPTPVKTVGKRPALLVFPFEPHSLVMAGLSRKHLAAAGFDVELLCYPDASGSEQWLWGQVLSEADARNYEELVVIGGRPDPSATAQLLQTAARWRAAGAQICLLNRHEASWARLPAMLQLSVGVVLGGDWAYFWGDAPSRADLAWGRIAALCTRDPTQSSVGLVAEEHTVAQGLLRLTYDAARQPTSDTAGWTSLATPILDRIAADDRAVFAAQADGFSAKYATATAVGEIHGRVLRYCREPGASLPSCYWVLERGIEQHGRAPERGIHFNVPYAVATWQDGDAVDVLAISHWREEEAVPIRLLYPDEAGPLPGGNECTIQVRLPAAQAEAVVDALVDACNRA